MFHRQRKTIDWLTIWTFTSLQSSSWSIQVFQQIGNETVHKIEHIMLDDAHKRLIQSKSTSSMLVIIGSDVIVADSNLTVAADCMSFD